MLIENYFACVTVCTQTHTRFLKRSALLFWDTRGNIDQEKKKKKGCNAKYGLKMRPTKSGAFYQYSRSLPSYKYWKRDTSGERKQPNGTFEKWHT